MAPDETSTTWQPRPTRPATASTSAFSLAVSSPSPAVVSDDEPTLTTTRFALEIASRTSLTAAPPPPCPRSCSPLFRLVRLVVGHVGGRTAAGPALAAPLTPRLLALGCRHPVVLFEAWVGAAARQVRHGSRRRRFPVERVVADRHPAARFRAHAREFLFHPEAVEAVAEVPDGLVVAEVGLPHPTLRARSAHDVPFRVGGIGFDGETAVVDRRRREDDLGGF